MKTENTLIWDLPTRLFHWLFVLSFIIAWATHDDNRFLFAHVYAGYLFITLIGFRLMWGVFGSRYAQFRSFSYDWPSVYQYIKNLATGNAAKYIGHNPAGSWAIFLMIMLSLIVSLSGLLVFGGEEGHGPLASLTSYQVGEYSKHVHIYSAWAMLMITIVHVIGVIVESLYHKENLILSMITGRKHVHKNQGIGKHPVIGYALLFAVMISGPLYFKGYIEQTEDAPYIPFVGAPLPDNETWRTECGDCHLAYHPVLLPARSWRLLMENQNEHFEEALDLDEETIIEITNFLTTNASESKLNEPARKINASTPASSTPIRIIDTNYWKQKHQNIDNKYWKHEKVGSKGNCAACHLDADKGHFEDSAMRLPK